MTLSKIVARRVSGVLPSLMGVEAVLALHGPRSVGKSTILREFAQSAGVEVIDLDDVAVREAVQGNLRSVVASRAPLCIDEYQRVPDILDAIKARLNSEGTVPGTALITGSTRQDALPSTAQALTGRLHSLTIWPLSQGEIAGVTENFVEALIANPSTLVSTLDASHTTRQEYVERVCAGGFPLALKREGADRARWFDDFVQASLERDALELSRIRERQALADLLTLVAAQTGQILNITKVAEAIGVSRASIEGHLRLLEDLFLVVRLPAWGKTLRSRVTARPKVHLVDTGLAARLLRVSPQKLAGLDPATLSEFGHLLETFVLGEVRKQVSWLPEPVSVGHWRTSDGSEVDIVLELSDGRVIGIEVKSSERAVAHDFRGLRALKSSLGSRFHAGVVLTMGHRPYTFDDDLHVLPLSSVWTPVGEG
jgi:predicted AAA+ superfamily ATPase